MDVLPPSLAPLAAWAQFVTWFAMPVPDKPGKFAKFPCHWQTGIVCDAQDPANWTTAENALRNHKLHDRGYGSGPGFVVTEADPIFFHDIDGCLQADNTWSPLALELCARFPGAAIEVSHSGRGLHVLGMAWPHPIHSTRNIALGLELYTGRRFVALTGINVTGNAGTDHTPALHALAAQYFPPGVTVHKGDWTTEPVAEWSGPADDNELVRRALASAAKSVAGAFGDKLTFADLWVGSVPENARSEADQSLANHLAFWTGKNCERIERLMRASGLLREKWDNPAHVNYLTNTILKACAVVSTVAQQTAAQAPALPPVNMEALAVAAVAAGRQTRDTNTEYLDPQAQLAHFDGCTFLADSGRVFSLHRNAIMARDSFDVVYGGHLFQIDPMGQARPIDSAWTAFTKSRVNVPPIVDDLCFRPEVAPGAIITVGRHRLVNSYVPYDCPVLEGDPAPFLDLLTRMLPDARDRALLLNYLASLTQNPGVKFQWWPVLQGVQGNGKTLVVRLMSYIMGEQYSHLPNAAAMARDGMKFNSWIHRKLFIGIEEVALANKREFLEEFKVVITNDRISLERKGVDQFTGDNRVNGIICTQHKDGVPIDDKERRYGIFFTAQQAESDLIRDGMGGNYFPDLYDWFYGRRAYAGRPGAAILAGYLKTLVIDAAMDPATTLMRAPVTTSTMDARQASLGRAEQYVQEAIEEGRPGFAGGWVSSYYLNMLLDTHRIIVPLNKRRGLMQSLGYDWHPGLDNGRVNDVVAPDGAKPKLFIRTGHVALAVTGNAEVGKAYTAAQQAAPTTGAVVLAFGGANSLLTKPS